MKFPPKSGNYILIHPSSDVQTIKYFGIKSSQRIDRYSSRFLGRLFVVFRVCYSIYECVYNLYIYFSSSHSTLYNSILCYISSSSMSHSQQDLAFPNVYSPVYGSTKNSHYRVSMIFQELCIFSKISTYVIKLTNHL